MMKKAFVVTAVLALLCAGATVNASVLLVDRGLPTANLNNDAGADRSNVAWVFNGYTSSTDYWLVGDTFKNTSAQTWSINTIQLWSMNPIVTASLWGGVDGSSIGVVSASGVISGTTYADSTTYQGSSGSYRNLYRLILPSISHWHPARRIISTLMGPVVIMSFHMFMHPTRH